MDWRARIMWPRQYTKSFPAKCCAYDLKSPGPEGSQKDWDAISPLVGQLHADLEIQGQLSEGRIGLVFAARLVTLRRSPHDEPLPVDSVPLPSQFCIKLAKPEYIRSLAQKPGSTNNCRKSKAIQVQSRLFVLDFLLVLCPVDAGLKYLLYPRRASRPSHRVIPQRAKSLSMTTTMMTWILKQTILTTAEPLTVTLHGT
ncbi:hypothetical protein BDP27DRAFT_78925 [Rhodocollybia butyracea]|uniref:Uncharacterized protein n=1 Tax=Rhodocollybia butyracea TaxID=206335 RepID=A0A9P5U3Z6_9AGAR|nr:hypothetical protein BDP27DRAFT_78925 [Rhodocollybia butyracea]